MLIQFEINNVLKCNVLEMACEALPSMTEDILREMLMISLPPLCNNLQI